MPSSNNETNCKFYLSRTLCSSECKVAVASVCLSRWKPRLIIPFENAATQVDILGVATLSWQVSHALLSNGYLCSFQITCQTVSLEHINKGPSQPENFFLPSFSKSPYTLSHKTNNTCTHCCTVFSHIISIVFLPPTLFPNGYNTNPLDIWYGTNRT